MKRDRNLKQHPFYKKFLTIEMPRKDFALFGSAMMYIKNIVEDMHDLDIVARGKAWKKALQKGRQETAMAGDKKVTFFNSDIEIFQNWFGSKFPGMFDTNELIDNAETIDGIKVIDLPEVLRWLEKLDVEKYQKRAKLVGEYLRNTST